MRLDQTEWRSSGTSGVAWDPTTPNPPRPGTSTPRSTQLVTSCTANSGLPAVRSARAPASSPEKPSRPAISSSRSSGGRGRTWTRTPDGWPSSRSTSSASDGRSANASSRAVSRNRTGSARSTIGSSIQRTNRITSPPHWTSSSTTTAGRRLVTSASSDRTTSNRSSARAGTAWSGRASGATRVTRPLVDHVSSGPDASSTDRTRCRLASACNPPSRRCRRTRPVSPSSAVGVSRWLANSASAAPNSWARVATKDDSRDLPVPAAPRRNTTRGCPSRAVRRSSPHSTSRSLARPTRGIGRSPCSPRPAPTRWVRRLSVATPRQLFGTGRAGGSPARCSSPHAASAASWKRSAVAFSSSRRSHSSRPGGIGSTGSKRGTGFCRCPNTTARTSPGNGGAPVASCHAVQPSAYRSVQGP